MLGRRLELASEGGGKSVYDVITYCTSRAVCKDGSSNFEAEGLKG